MAMPMCKRDASESAKQHGHVTFVPWATICRPGDNLPRWQMSPSAFCRQHRRHLVARRHLHAKCGQDFFWLHNWMLTCSSASRLSGDQQTIGKEASLRVAVRMANSKPVVTVRTSQIWRT